MDALIDDYNACVKKAVKKVYFKYAFTVTGIALGVLGGALLNPLASIGAFLSIVQFAAFDKNPFAAFDKNPVVNADESEPAAMFHDIKRIGKWELY